MTKRNKLSYPKVCNYCDKEFVAFRKDHRFCSQDCSFKFRYKRSSGSQRLWSDKNKDRIRELHLKRRFGITSEQYQQLLEKQEYSCAICKRHQSELNRKLAVDHNHKSGLIRGLLCTHCNGWFIGRHSDPDKFERASHYLRQDTGWVIPPKIRKKTSGKKLRTRNKSNVLTTRL